MLEGLKEIGPVQHMIIPFGSASLGKVDRLIQYDLGGSLILDCVVYSFNIALDIFKEEPIQHIALGTINDEGGRAHRLQVSQIIFIQVPESERFSR